MLTHLKWEHARQWSFGNKAQTDVVYEEGSTHTPPLFSARKLLQSKIRSLSCWDCKHCKSCKVWGIIKLCKAHTTKMMFSVLQLPVCYSRAWAVVLYYSGSHYSKLILYTALVFRLNNSLFCRIYLNNLSFLVKKLSSFKDNILHLLRAAYFINLANWNLSVHFTVSKIDIYIKIIISESSLIHCHFHCLLQWQWTSYQTF